MWSRLFGVVVGVSGGISNVVSFIWYVSKQRFATYDIKGTSTAFCVTWYFMATNVAMKYDVEQIYSSEVTTA